MDGVGSAKTLIISDREEATRKNIVADIEDAEVIFFTGGDQCQYLRNYLNTEVDRGVKSVIARGGAILLSPHTLHNLNLRSLVSYSS